MEKRIDAHEKAASSNPEHRVATTELEPNNASRRSIALFFILVCAFGFALGFGLPFALPLVYRIIIGAAVGLIGAFSLRIAPQWERVVILRFGRFHRIAGPGPFFCVPLVDHVPIHIDQRIMTSSFSAEAALTADLVPVDVDAVLFWMVWDAKKACLEVENYPKAVLCSAQTAMRDAIGMLSLADISLRRREIDHDLGKRLM